MESQYIKKKNFIINTIYILLIGVIVYFSVKYALGLVSPFLFAFGIAYLLKSPAKHISSALRIPRKLVSVALVLVFYSTIGMLIALIGVKLISTVATVISGIPLIYEGELEPFLRTSFDSIEQAFFRLNPALVDVLNNGFNQFVNSLGQNITNLSLKLVGAISNLASSLPAFFIRILLMVITTFFIACDYEIMARFILRQFSEKGRGVILSIKQYMINTLFVVIRSYALIMSITFIELTIGLSIIKIPNAILIALIVALFDILPLVGTGGIMIPWTIITFLQGNYQIAIGLLAVYIFITIVRNIIEPKIVGSQLGLHPVVTLICMFIGANLFGVIGLFGFPITLSLLKHLNDTGTIKLFK
ncbi:MAG: sporulation integral membrane protein YtvI [Aminipila sp.]